MKCSEIRKLLALHAGGDLDEAEAARVNEHVASCGQCAKLLVSLRCDRGMLAGLRRSGPEQPAFDEFWDGLRTKLAPETRRKRTRLLLHRVVRAATVAAVLLVAALFLFDVESEKQPGGSSTVQQKTLWVESQTETEQQGLEMEECELCIDSQREYDF